MEQSPSLEAHRSSASQEIPRILLNPKFHYSIQKNPPSVPILNEIDPVHAHDATFRVPILVLSSHLRLTPTLHHSSVVEVLPPARTQAHTHTEHKVTFTVF
jgi:hypothetical protein